MSNKDIKAQEMAECATAIKEVRVYKLNDKYSVEVENEERDGLEFVDFYLVDGTNKYFCFGTKKEWCCYEKDERALAHVCEDYIETFEEEQKVLDYYYKYYVWDKGEC